MRDLRKSIKVDDYEGRAVIHLLEVYSDPEMEIQPEDGGWKVYAVYSSRAVALVDMAQLNAEELEEDEDTLIKYRVNTNWGVDLRDAEDEVDEDVIKKLGVKA